MAYGELAGEFMGSVSPRWTALDKRVLCELLQVIAESQEAYPTTVEEDAGLLQTAMVEGNWQVEQMIVVRMSEKTALEQAAAHLEAQLCLATDRLAAQRIVE
eukprot:scaffold3473_cov385-Prasinococcus_capsulatus_cf.AAC.4